jgi:hypothetical protein
MRPDLTDVTICAADCLTPGLAAQALIRSMALCNFGDSILLTDADIAGAFRTVRIAPIRSKQAYSQFILKDLVHHIQTPFVLVVQWDGFVVDPAMWRPQYRNFDYIGARFIPQEGGVPVGNGGFSLRSAKLLRAVDSADFNILPDFPEDDLICRINRDVLMSKYGITYAPPELAEQFSYEWYPAPGPTFGFHGLSHIWRHMDDSAVIALADELDTSTLTSRLFVTLLVHYFSQQKYVTWRTLYKKMRTQCTPEAVALHLKTIIKNPDQSTSALKTWEKLAGI